MCVKQSVLVLRVCLRPRLCVCVRERECVCETECFSTKSVSETEIVRVCVCVSVRAFL